ncbi:MAG TPA: radical SAM family heme chaperone HemW [Candidatus Methylomirabilis sp.]|nr:radical SAM family heme chaperone HemW [Candidatus Methylomirabilis sp.]
MASLYIHIPFCERKCLYCDFYSVEGTERAAAFLAALSQEISLRVEHTDQASYESVFFGGGTPSLLEPAEVECMLSRLHTAFQIRPDAEMTLEANPGTLTGDKLRALRDLGVNRMSIGIQSFHDPELKALGRIHDRAAAFRAVELARAAGFDNLSLDLIYSIPGQTLPRWEASLRTAVDLAPQHISAYSLIVEDGTPLARMVERGQVRTNPVGREAEMYERTMEFLGAHGYEHYEVSNYALPGFRCRHNWAYWSHENYLGFGPSAHSFWKERDGKGGRRWWNVADLATYRDRLENGWLPVESEEDVGPHQMLDERIFLGIRTGSLDVRRLSRDFGYDFAAQRGKLMRWMVQEDLVVLEQEVLRLTPRGFLLCDEICSRLLP